MQSLVPGAELKELLGKRPGEALGCVHASECSTGCGTTEFCSECGAVRAILASLGGRKDCQECRMIRVTNSEEEAIDLAPGSATLEIVTDSRLLRRILGNLIKNALEASQPGQTVTAGCAEDEGGVRFWVHNPTFMPPRVQLQVFNRSFSTKGSGRGLGTCSVRLLAERYLNGKAGFTSSEEGGTVFFVILPKHLGMP